MSAGAAAGDGAYRCVFEGCISCDTGIERRPYHRNCSCALHKSRKLCPHSKRSGMNVSYPIRRTWSEGCLSLAAASSPSVSPSLSPAVSMTNLAEKCSQLSLCCREGEEDQEQDDP